MPEMDIKTFTSVAEVMTAKELMSFKDAFLKKSREKALSFKLKQMMTKHQIQ